MLTVYKASAGSGKTFRLAVEYIKQLIIAPNNYEHTLAVTFTNKATEEMKMRILSQLYGLANHLDASKGYLNVILDDLNRQYYAKKKIDENFIAERAGMALTRLLHNYSFFRVETIDKFFQSVLRNLARELDLSRNLRVELSAKEIEYKAVDTWIDNLKESDKELGWILDYVQSNMQEDKKWNVIGNIKTFGEQLLHDDYKAHSQQLAERLDGNDQEFYRQYTSQLRAIITDADKQINAAGTELWDLIMQHGFDEESFAQKKRGVGAFIHRMTTESISTLEPNSYVNAACDPDDSQALNWTPKKAPQSLRDLCREVLRPRFLEVMQHFRTLQCLSRSSSVTLHHLSELRMLRSIQQEIIRSNAEHDRFLLSDTQNLLSKMIDGSDSPFIFEKIGSRLHNIMIDEFQDTSRIQWQNFKVLLNDCMSHGHNNLIVGDVKQSIYRWRSGDWRLLNNISDEFIQPINTKSLTINRRSSTRVIDFNNAFFVSAAQRVYEEAAAGCKPEDAEMLRKAYSDVAQQYPEGKATDGYVEVRLIGKEDYHDSTLTYISDTIATLIHRGVHQRDIAILVRNNKEISTIALHCSTVFRNAADEALHSVRIVSDDGFLLKASPAVCIIIDAIRLLLNPNNDIVRARLSLSYQRYVLANGSPQQQLLEIQTLPETYLSGMDHLVTLPLYQLCEQLYSLFDIAKLTHQSAYVCYFFDCLTEYINNSVGDIQGFIDHWDEHMCNKSIESDSDNGIRILTIHKSKGLEYGHVIIPYCDWQLEKSPIIWCSPTEAPFNALPVIPLNFSSKTLINSIYEASYWEEHMQNLVDNINLLYVAFTRAKQGLYISTQRGQKPSYRGWLIESVLNDVGTTLASFGEVTIDDDGLSYGSFTIGNDRHDDGGTESNVFLQSSTPLPVTVRNTQNTPEFRESNKSQEFLLTEEEEAQQQRSQYIQMGNILHALFATIHTADNIPSALLRLEMDGMLYGQDITAEALNSHINECLRNPQIADWFSDRWHLYNECTILEYDAANDTHIEHRPDRVMTDGRETIVVDFKLFSFKPSYRTQVQRYMELLHRMGHSNVRGYLWMIMSNKVYEIK